MPIVASRSAEIRRLLGELTNPRRRAGAVLRLRGLGSRVVPHAAEELARLDPEARRALAEALLEVDTDDARNLRRRLLRADPGEPPARAAGSAPGGAGARTSGLVRKSEDGLEARALRDLRALPPPGAAERPGVSRERGEAHLALARLGSRLARKDLLLSLVTLDPRRTGLYCEAAGLIGDLAFLKPLAGLAGVRTEAAAALAQIARRERLTARSKAIRDLDESLRPVVARALAGP